MKPLKVGIIGLGTVGLSLYKILKKRKDLNIEIVSLCDKNNKVKIHKQDRYKFETDYKKTLNSDAEIIIELIGGLNPAETIIKKALKNGKNIITANKELLAKKGKNLFNLADKKNKSIKYEASVGGAIPIISNLKRLKTINTIKSIKGILNGTTNYILSQMHTNDISFSLALQKAQKNGFAEENPALDISGKDAIYKTILLTFTAFNKWINFSNVKSNGIKKISIEDIQKAKSSGKKIKLICTVKKLDHNPTIKVAAEEIDASSNFYNIENEFNAVEINGEFFDSLLFKGKGAGGFPTASSVLSNILEFRP
ncbi:MAG: homoserine dehydrogenase [Candidatus Mcinerneyibacterium aminivorans]|uniref:Homoserine dehydrogenase n=1 Tax=Candidatus Mcinerneyibacterium aminivorans TaxID=2703815 RepID=A0A5D0MCI0_9BACT|nr:MAG: homoserine dehydrogenase [Candidatus Mcinerneyibacterium aminivorans]